MLSQIQTVLDTERKGTAYEFSIDSLKFAKGAWELALVIKNDSEIESIDTVAKCSFVANPFKKQASLHDLASSLASDQTSIDGGAAIIKRASEIVANYEKDKQAFPPIDFTAAVVKFSSANTTKITLRIVASIALQIHQNLNAIIASAAVCVSSENA